MSSEVFGREKIIVSEILYEEGHNILLSDSLTRGGGNREHKLQRN